MWQIVIWLVQVLGILLYWSCESCNGFQFACFQAKFSALVMTYKVLKQHAKINSWGSPSCSTSQWHLLCSIEALKDLSLSLPSWYVLSLELWLAPTLISFQCQPKTTYSIQPLQGWPSGQILIILVIAALAVILSAPFIFGLLLYWLITLSGITLLWRLG